MCVYLISGLNIKDKTDRIIIDLFKRPPMPQPNPIYDRFPKTPLNPRNCPDDA